MIYFPPLYNQILLVLINLVGVWLAGTVWRRRDGDRATRKLFVFMIFLMFGWVDFAYIPRVLGEAFPVFGFIALKIAWFMTPLFFLFLFFLVISLMGEGRRYGLISIAAGIAGFGSAVLTGFTDFVVAGMQAGEGIIRIQYGSAMYPFLGVISFLIAATLFVTFHSYAMLPQEKRRKVQYFVVGLVIFYIANIIFNVALPVWLGIVRWYWIGDYSTIAVLGFTGYAIIARGLFGIRIVLAALLVGSISILLLVDLVAFTEPVWMRAVKGLTFLLFLVFGYALARSVSREIRQQEELSLAYEKLKQLDQAKSEFISIASHQLRTPLTAIKGYISMILEGTYGRLTKKLESPLQSVADSNERLIKLVNNLLNISRIESGRITMEIEEVNLQEVGESVRRELEGKMAAKGISFETNVLAGRPPVIRADKEKIRNVLLNIIDNAIRYTEKGGITLTIIPGNEGSVRVEIADTGSGMTQEEMEGLFESFSRGKAGQRLWTEGAGLGLYIAKKFVAMHGGEIHAESKGKGEGSTFVVELPHGNGIARNQEP